MTKTIVGLFDDLSTAQEAVLDLENNGFNRSDISLMARDQGRGGEYGQGALHEGNRAGEGAAAGAGTGAVLGGLAGLVVGLTALAIPGIGPIIAAGPLVTTLAGAGAGAVAGGILGALTGAGVPQEDAQAYAEGVRRGGTLLMVRSSDETAGQARDIINRYHPVDLSSRSEYWRKENWRGFDEQGQPFNDEDVTRERDYWRSNAPMASGAAGSDYGVHSTDYDEDRPGSNEMSGRSMLGSDYGSDRPNAGEMSDRGAMGTGYGAGSAASSGRGYTGMRRDFNDYSNDFRSDFNSTYQARGHDFGYYEPAYRYGYDLAGNQRYQGRQWNEFEAEARRDWEFTHPNSPWDDVKEAVRHAYERVTGA